MQGLHKAVLRWVIHFMCLCLCYCVMVVSTLGQSTLACKHTPQLTGKRPKRVGLVSILFKAELRSPHLSFHQDEEQRSVLCIVFCQFYSRERQLFVKQ